MIPGVGMWGCFGLSAAADHNLPCALRHIVSVIVLYLEFWVVVLNIVVVRARITDIGHSAHLSVVLVLELRALWHIRQTLMIELNCYSSLEFLSFQKDHTR